MNPITRKAQMYDALARGEFGNTIPQYFSVEAWEADPAAQRIAVWGVRSMVPSGPCRMYVPREELLAVAAKLAEGRVA